MQKPKQLTSDASVVMKRQNDKLIVHARLHRNRRLTITIHVKLKEDERIFRNGAQRTDEPWQILEDVLFLG